MTGGATDSSEREAAWQAYFQPRAEHLRRAFGDDAVQWLRLAFEAGWDSAADQHADR